MFNFEDTLNYLGCFGSALWSVLEKWILNFFLNYISSLTGDAPTRGSKK